MAFVPPKDRVMETSISNGQSVFALVGAVDASFNRFSGSMSVGDVTFGAVVEPGVAFKTGILTYSATNQVTIDSTGFESKGTFSSSGTKEVFMGLPAARGTAGAAPGLNVSNLSLSVSAAAGALTVEMRDAAGNVPSAISPVVIDFRSATATSSVPIQRAVTAANSVVAASGVTLGTTNAVAFRLWVIAFDDGGTIRLGLINCSTASRVYGLDEGTLQTSQQIGAGANVAGMFYTAGAAVTNKAFRILGYIEWNASGVATAGSWTTTNLAGCQIFGPGIKKPGERVSLQSVTSNNTDVWSSASYTSSSLSYAATLSNVANKCLVRITGNVRTQGGGTAALLQLRRNGSVALASGYCAGIANLRVPVIMEAFDAPNSLSPVYAPYIASSDGVTPINFPESPSNPQGAIVVEEIMG